MAVGTGYLDGMSGKQGISDLSDILSSSWDSESTGLEGMLQKTLCTFYSHASSCGSSLAELLGCPGTPSGAESLPQERQDSGSWSGFALVKNI